METNGTSNFSFNFHISFSGHTAQDESCPWFVFLIPQELESFVPNLDPNGIDLLSVSSLTMHIYIYIYKHTSIHSTSAVNTWKVDLDVSGFIYGHLPWTYNHPVLAS